MKRDSGKAFVSVLLACAVQLCLVACGNPGGKGDGSDSQTSGNVKEEEGSSGEETGKEPVTQTITISTIDHEAGNANVGDYAEEIRNRIEEYTGVNIEISWVANDVLEEKNSLYLTDPKTMPQIITWGSTMTGNVVAAAKSGAFVDLNDYIWDSEKYPNLSAMSRDVAGNLTIDGKLIAVPRTRVIGRYGLSYRTDWFEALQEEWELEEPDTPEAVYKMLYAFTYGDPDGNGVDDTIGMEMTLYTGPFDIIQTWFGCGNGWAEVDGRLVPVWMQEEYWDAVDYIKKLYDDGLMPKDWASRPTDTWSDGCKTGKNGVFIDVLDSGKRIWQYYLADGTYTASVTDPGKAASMTLHGAVNGHTLATSGYAGYFTLSASTLDTPKKIEAALTFLDKLNDPEMLILTQYGLEGIHYEINEEGYLVDLDVEDKVLGANYTGLNQMLAYLPSMEVCNELIPLEQDEPTKVLNQAYADNLPYAIVNPALSYLVNSAAYSDDGAALDTQIAAARTQYICGAITREQFEAELQKARDTGYDQIIEEVNAQYQANQEK